MCGECVGTRCFRSNPTSPPLPGGSNANCLGWSVAIAAEWRSYRLVVDNRPWQAACFGRCTGSRHMWVEAPPNLSFVQKCTMGFMCLSFWMAAAKKIDPHFCCNFFLNRSVSSSFPIVVALSVLSITLAMISSWMISKLVSRFCWWCLARGRDLGSHMLRVHSVDAVFILFINFHCDFRFQLHIVVRL